MLNPHANISEISHYIPQFIWKFWLSPCGPNDLPRDSRVHVYNVYDNELSETRQLPAQFESVFKDLDGDLASTELVQAAEQAFYHLESEAATTLNRLIERTYASGTPTRTNSFYFDRARMESLSRYLTFLRFRNSIKYREILRLLEESSEENHRKIYYPVYGPIIAELRRQTIFREFIRFLQHSSADGAADHPRNLRPETNTSSGPWLDAFRGAMDMCCWRLCKAEVCIGIASEDQEFIFSDSCFGTLDEGFNEDPECCDLFFPILPTFALYILGNPHEHDCASRHINSSTVQVPVGVEFPVDVHLRNSMILQTYPRHLYFSALRPISLSISSYDEFRWIQEHQDYSRLKQRCRQKFLQETVTKTLVVKGSLVLTDLTDEVIRVGTSAVGFGGFSDVWKGVWNDPVEKRPRNVAIKVLRQIMVKNVKEKLMKRLQAEVVAWHKLCHRNVSQLIGVVQFDDSIGMVSPWCDNGTISHYLKNHSQANRMSLIIQIASGIVYLHAFEPVIIHGDLKGGNILIDEHGRPIITDFGLSQVIEDMSDTINIGSSFFAGSTRWMAPELVLALVEDDGRAPPITTFSDVYAFASVCLEIATGQLPYPHRTNDHAVTVDIMRGVKPSRGAQCLIQLKNEDAFWTTLDHCWSQACYLRPSMPELLQLLESMAFHC